MPFGEFQYSVDDKGRVIVPPPFREFVEDGMVVTRGMEGCLYVFPLAAWRRIEDRLTELPLTDNEARNFVRFFYSGAAKAKIDAAVAQAGANDLTIVATNRAWDVAAPPGHNGPGQSQLVKALTKWRLDAVEQMTEHAQEVGANFISLVPPPFGGADKGIIVGYFEMVAREIDLGITIFNTAQSGYTLTPELMAELAEIPNVCALKNGMPMAHTIQVRQHAGDQILVIDPDEENFLVNMLEFGQQAIYTGTSMMFDSTRDQPMKRYVDAGLAGRSQEAAQQYYEMQPLRDLHRRWVLDEWQRTGTRSDGVRFTVESFARYLIHDPVHHLDDARKGLGVLGQRY
jgi:hypothetical protein